MTAFAVWGIFAVMGTLVFWLGLAHGKLDRLRLANEVRERTRLSMFQTAVRLHYVENRPISEVYHILIAMTYRREDVDFIIDFLRRTRPVVKARAYAP